MNDCSTRQANFTNRAMAGQIEVTYKHRLVGPVFEGCEVAARAALSRLTAGIGSD